MKKIILACMMLFPFMGIAAQESETRKQTTVNTSGDSIIILKGEGNVKIKIYEENVCNDTRQEEKLFEGVYLTRIDSDRPSILDALPFAPKKRNRFDPHSSGFYMGFSRLTKDFYSFGPTGKASLDAGKSWEIGANLFSSHIALTRDRHWGMTFGLGWGYTSFRLDGNQAFLKAEGSTGVFDGDEETMYNKSRLRYFHFRIPISIEWQTRINGRRPVFFAAGPEVEIRHGVKSMAKVNGHKETLGKGMYVHPVGINLLAQAGYGSLGFYLRYSTYGLFEKGKGPDVSPMAFGICWYW